VLFVMEGIGNTQRAKRGTRSSPSMRGTKLARCLAEKLAMSGHEVTRQARIEAALARPFETGGERP
jgi:hypothetical protein